MCVGHVASDRMFGVQAFPALPTKTPAINTTKVWAGCRPMPLWPWPVWVPTWLFVAQWGDDAAADVFAQHFQREGVDASRMQGLGGHSSLVSAIIIDSHGERMIFNHRGSALTAQAAFDPAWPKRVRRSVAEATAALGHPSASRPPDLGLGRPNPQAVAGASDTSVNQFA